MVRPFGIQSSAQMRAKLVAEGTPHIDFFPVLAVEANELIVGANDSHLDFRIAVVHRQRRETPTNQKRWCWLPWCAAITEPESFISR